MNRAGALRYVLFSLPWALQSGCVFAWVLLLSTPARALNFARAAARLGVLQSTLSHQTQGFAWARGAPPLNHITRAAALTKTAARLCQTRTPRVPEIAWPCEGRALSDPALDMLRP